MNISLCRRVGHYSVLGVPRDATKANIHKAYLRLAKKYHPDKNSATKETFQKIQEAKDVLSDPVQRREYDMQHFGGGFGDRASSSSGPGPSSEHYSRSGRQEGTYTVFTVGGRKGQSPYNIYNHSRAQEEYIRNQQRRTGPPHQSFDEMMYHRKMLWAVTRVVPFIFPLSFLILALTYSSVGSNSGVHPYPSTHPGNLVFDSQGNAYARDAHGRFHRLPELSEK